MRRSIQSNLRRMQKLKKNPLLLFPIIAALFSMLALFFKMKIWFAIFFAILVSCFSGALIGFVQAWMIFFRARSSKGESQISAKLLWTSSLGFIFILLFTSFAIFQLSTGTFQTRGSDKNLSFSDVFNK